jgi:hypothetical protein
MNQVAAGWYADPHNPTQRRYWDGSKWTEHTDAQQAAAPAQPAQQAAQPAQPAEQPAQQAAQPAQQAEQPASGPQSPAAGPQSPAVRPQAPIAQPAVAGQAGVVAQPRYAAPAAKASKPGPPGIAVAGFVTGLIGLLLSVSVVCWFIGLPLAIAGIVLGVLGQKQAKEQGAPTGLALAGMICGIVGVVAGVIVTALVVIAS